MPSFKIADKKVGDDAPVYIVAELSANHGQSLEKALKAVEAAAAAGADAIKLQTYTPDTLTLRSSAPPFVVKTKNAWSGRTLHDLYAEAMTPWEWHATIMDAARSHGLACFSTPFDATAAYFLEGLKAPAYKIASFELVDLPLIETVARLGKPIIMSTGMASLGDIEAALDACKRAGNDEVALLRCVSSYPADPANMALSSLGALRELGVVLGFSDHTRDDVAAIAAVSLGAKLIEKHFIVDRSWGGPDSFFSLEPDEFKRLVKAVRTTEAAVGRPRFGPSSEEVATLAFRRSLFVARDVEAGQVLTIDDVRSVRPSDGLPVKHLPTVLGRTATRAIKAAEPLAWEMVGPEAPIPGISLRLATRSDAALLLGWRNDPETRQASRSSSLVSPQEHESWLTETLQNPHRRLYVAELGGVSVGQVRLDRLGGGKAAEVSITVAPTSRGKGLAAAMLRALEAPAREAGYRSLVAEIRENNPRSLRAFKLAGYYGFGLRGGAAENLWRCERRIEPVLS